MYSLTRRYLIFAMVCLVGLVVSGQAQAQTDADIFRDEMSQTEAEIFNDEVWQIAHRGHKRRPADDAIIWGAGESRWRLKNESVPSGGLAKYSETFLWSGTRISFDRVFCAVGGDYNRLQYLSVNGHIDFTQSGDGDSGSISSHPIAWKLSLANPTSTEEDCVPASEISNYLDAGAMFTVSTGAGDSVSLDFYSPDSETPIRLIYEPDRAFEPLAQSDWKLRKDNGAPEKYCAPLKISSTGTIRAGCCNAFSSQLKKTTTGWAIGQGGVMTTMACGEKKRNRADDQMSAALAGGFYMNNEGQLVAGGFVFDSVNEAGKAQGKWRLSDAEGREYLGRIFPLPKRLKIHQKDALKDLDVILTVESDRLLIRSNCRIYRAKIVGRKAGFLRLGETGFEDLEDCVAAQKGVKQGVSLLISHFAAKNAAVEFDYDRHSDSLSLTRAGVGVQAASVRGEFQRVE